MNGISQTGQVAHPLAVARQQAGLSTRKLGALSGVSYVSISHIENHRVTPRLETMQKLANALAFFSRHKVSAADITPHPNGDPRADVTSAWYDPDHDPDVPSVPQELRDAEQVIHLGNTFQIDFLKQGKRVATQTADGLRICAVGGTVITISSQQTPARKRAGGRPRGRRTRKSSASSDSDDGPGEPEPGARRRAWTAWP